MLQPRGRQMPPRSWSPGARWGFQAVRRLSRASTVPTSHQTSDRRNRLHKPSWLVICRNFESTYRDFSHLGHMMTANQKNGGRLVFQTGPPRSQLRWEGEVPGILGQNHARRQGAIKKWEANIHSRCIKFHGSFDMSICQCCQMIAECPETLGLHGEVGSGKYSRVQPEFYHGT